MDRKHRALFPPRLAELFRDGESCVAVNIIARGRVRYEAFRALRRRRWITYGILLDRLTTKLNLDLAMVQSILGELVSEGSIIIASGRRVRIASRSQRPRREEG